MKKISIAMCFSFHVTLNALWQESELQSSHLFYFEVKSYIHETTWIKSKTVQIISFWFPLLVCNRDRSCHHCSIIAPKCGREYKLISITISFLWESYALGGNKLCNSRTDRDEWKQPCIIYRLYIHVWILYIFS